MSEVKFLNGLRVYAPNEKAPDREERGNLTKEI